MTEEQKLIKLEEKYEKAQEDIRELTKLVQEINFTKLDKKESLEWLKKITEMEKDILALKISFEVMQKDIHKLTSSVEQVLKNLETITKQNTETSLKEKLVLWVFGLGFSAAAGIVILKIAELLLK